MHTVDAFAHLVLFGSLCGCSLLVYTHTHVPALAIVNTIERNVHVHDDGYPLHPAKVHPANVIAHQRRARPAPGRLGLDAPESRVLASPAATPATPNASTTVATPLQLHRNAVQAMSRQALSVRTGTAPLAGTHAQEFEAAKHLDARNPKGPTGMHSSETFLVRSNTAVPSTHPRAAAKRGRVGMGRISLESAHARLAARCQRLQRHPDTPIATRMVTSGTSDRASHTNTSSVPNISVHILGKAAIADYLYVTARQPCTSPACTRSFTWSGTGRN